MREAIGIGRDVREAVQEDSKTEQRAGQSGGSAALMGELGDKERDGGEDGADKRDI